MTTPVKIIDVQYELVVNILKYEMIARAANGMTSLEESAFWLRTLESVKDILRAHTEFLVLDPPVLATTEDLEKWLGEDPE